MNRGSVEDVLTGAAGWGVGVGDTLAWLRTLPAESVHCVVTSPPYFGLRAYLPAGHPDAAAEVGREDTPAAYVARLVAVFAEVRRVLHPSGTVWLNIGDSYSGGGGYSPDAPSNRANDRGVTNGGKSGTYKGRKPADGFKPKDRLMIPARVALALQADGWWLRDEIVWAKPSPMPQSVRDRTCAAHEMVYLLTKRPRYYFDQVAIQEPASRPGDTQTFGGAKARNGTIASTDPRYRNGSEQWGRNVTAGETRIKRSVWRVSATPVKDAHFATMPLELAATPILAGSSERGVCPCCWEPWARVVKKSRAATRPGEDSKTTGDAMTDGNRDPLRHVTRTETVGWAAGCGCGLTETIPALVLDPFAGSGTTLLAAKLLGRRAIGCELNPDYVPIIEKRVGSGVFGAGLPVKGAKKPKPKSDSRESSNGKSVPGEFVTPSLFGGAA